MTDRNRIDIATTIFRLTLNVGNPYIINIKSSAARVKSSKSPATTDSRWQWHNNRPPPFDLPAPSSSEGAVRTKIAVVLAAANERSLDHRLLPVFLPTLKQNKLSRDDRVDARRRAVE